MARETTKKGRLGGLQKFRDALSTNREVLPHLDGSFTQFDARVTGALELSNRQGALTAEKQEISKQLTDALDEAERLATVLRLAIKQHFGIRAEKLAEFDLKPFRGRKKNAAFPTPQAKRLSPPSNPPGRRRAPSTPPAPLPPPRRKLPW